MSITLRTGPVNGTGGSNVSDHEGSNDDLEGDRRGGGSRGERSEEGGLAGDGHG